MRSFEFGSTLTSGGIMAAVVESSSETLLEVFRVVKLRKQTEGVSYYLVEWQGEGVDPLVNEYVRKRFSKFANQYLGPSFKGIEYTGGTLKLKVKIGTAREQSDSWSELFEQLPEKISAPKRVMEHLSELYGKLKTFIP